MSLGLRFAVLGCSSVASRRMMPALARNPETRIVAVASRDPDKGAAVAWPYGAAPLGYEEVLDRDWIDAVYVSLPGALNGVWARRAISAGKHVLCEKPCTLSVAEAEALCEQSRRSGRAFLECHDFVFGARHRELREIISSRRFGGTIHGSFRLSMPARKAGDWRLDKNLGGGALNDHGSYPLLSALEILGKVSTLSATIRMDRSGLDQGGGALLSSESGATVSCSWGFNSAYRDEATLVCELGSIESARHHLPSSSAAELRLYGADGSTLQPRLFTPSERFDSTLDTFVSLASARSETEPHLRRILSLAALMENIRTNSIDNAAASVQNPM